MDGAGAGAGAGNSNQNGDMNDLENEGFSFLDGKEIERYRSGISEKSMSISTEPFLTQRRNTTSQKAIVGANLCSIESLDYE